MIIQKNRIRKIDNYLPANVSDEVVLSIPIKGNEEMLGRMGFSAPYTNQQILPTGIGPISRLNAYGKEVVRRDLGKEISYSPREWCRDEWRGKGMTERVCSIVYRRYNRWCRELIEPPEVSLYSDEESVYSPVILTTDADLLLHTVNLFLEAFGSVTINDKNKVPLIDQSKVKKVDWKIIPIGDLPWEKVEKHLEPSILRLSPSKQAVYRERLRFIQSMNPDNAVIGEGGYRDYLIMSFEKANLHLIESTQYGNALYIIKDDWETLSQMSKAQILKSPNLIGRIIHRPNWQDEVEKLIGPLLR